VGQLCVWAVFGLCVERVSVRGKGEQWATLLDMIRALKEAKRRLQEHWGTA
jgi:hypothetical protein